MRRGLLKFLTLQNYHLQPSIVSKNYLKVRDATKNIYV